VGCATTPIPSAKTEQIRAAHERIEFPDMSPAKQPVKPNIHFQTLKLDGKMVVYLPWQEAWELNKYLNACEVNMQENEGRIEFLNRQTKQLLKLF
jgi:hypothetical protein